VLRAHPFTCADIIMLWPWQARAEEERKQRALETARILELQQQQREAYESSQSQAAADLQRRIEQEKEVMAAARAERARQEAARRQAEEAARRAAEEEAERVGCTALWCGVHRTVTVKLGLLLYTRWCWRRRHGAGDVGITKKAARSCACMVQLQQGPLARRIAA
jgi:hypothetical protein